MRGRSTHLETLRGRDQSLLRDFVQGDRRARVVQDGFFARTAFYFKLDDFNYQNWVSSAEQARNGLCRLLVETSEKPLDLKTGDEELRKALGLP